MLSLENEAPYLKSLPVFDGLSCDESRKLGNVVIEKTFQPKQLIFSTLEAVEYVYLVQEGHVKLYRRTEDGRENIIAILGVGDVFGEFIFCEKNYHSVFAEAFDKAQICILPHQKFIQMLLNEPAIAVKILANVGKRLAQSAYFIENISTYNIKLRLAKLLIYLVHNHASNKSEPVVLDIRLTHQDLAYMVATCRQTVTELMNQFKKDGMVSCQGKHIGIMSTALETWIRDYSSL